IFQNCGCDVEQRCGRQFLPGTIVFEQSTVMVIAKEPGGAAEVEFAFKERRAGEGFRSADPFKAAAYRRKLAYRKWLVFPRLHFHSSVAQSLLRAPEHQSCAAHRQEQHDSNDPTPPQSAK